MILNKEYNIPYNQIGGMDWEEAELLVRYWHENNEKKPNDDVNTFKARMEAKKLIKHG